MAGRWTFSDPDFLLAEQSIFHHLSMPGRPSKRTLEEAVDHEESGDEDYDDRQPSRSHAKKSRGRPTKRRRRTRNSDGSGVDDNSDEISIESFTHSEDEEPVPTNEHGRPMRRATKAKQTYAESEEDEDDFDRSEDSEDVIQPTPRKPLKKLIVTLKTGGTPAPPQRTLRTRSASHGGKHPPTPTETNPRMTRRSSRINHDDEETVVALTNSGNHVEVIRAGSRDPEGVPPRAMKGGKGLKYPSKSTIDEESEQVEEPEELEIKASQHEVAESDPQTQNDPEDVPRIVTDLIEAAEADGEDAANEEDDQLALPDSDEDDQPVARGRLRRSARQPVASPPAVTSGRSTRLTRRNLRASSGPSRLGGSRRRKSAGESSDFNPEAELEKEDEMSESSSSQDSPRKSQRQDDYESSSGRRSRIRPRRAPSRLSAASVADEPHELAAELADLKSDRKKRRKQSEIIYEDKPRRTRGNVDYRLLRPELNMPVEEADDDAAPTPSRGKRGAGGGGGGGWNRSLFSTYGPFGGGSGIAPVLGGPSGMGATAGVDSDSSDEETMQRPKAVGGTVGMTPTSAFPPGGLGLFPPAQPLNSDAAQTGTPANLGKIKDKQALADADPLGVKQDVNFDAVGGLQGHIDQLKEMVALPLLYPEIFMRFHITPPRGVLFHGPPGTGKTLLARALSNSISSQGKKVTFYMRKGADALSKWVGEAERQLRLLFEEARKNQPSIIFFDEIDGLAPVRSSKQEQIHASIVSTLLALMDGMDGRGQVIVIGATNRPDSIDPALRRPGRFDREFYFPLPNTEARRAILDIHTTGWDPPLPDRMKDELAMLTKGYGGADLRALCTEAALNAVQRRYPQIYKADDKLLIDPKTIEVMPKDFMISVKKMVPSSERSASSGAAPLPEGVAPLLRKPLADIQNIVAEVLPQKKRTTALEEAQYEEPADAQGFQREKMLQAFETSRVFRPRLLIKGMPGMGQQYLSAALLNHFEGIHIQSFDLSTLFGDSAASPEATVVRLFTEVKTHKPSVIYIPNVATWYDTVGNNVISTFRGLLRSIKPTDPIMLLGILECEKEDVDLNMFKDLFGYSMKNQYELKAPHNQARHNYFQSLIDFVKTAPNDFPDPADRKKRTLEILPPAPPEAPKPVTPPTKEEIKAQKKKDRQTLNLLKIRLQPIMDQIRTKYKKFRTGVIDDNQIKYLYDEADPGTVSSDLHTELLARASFRPFEVGQDATGCPGLVEAGTDKFFYNLDSVTIEKRLSNGYYKRPKDFLMDIKRLAKDAKAIGDQDRLLKANELLTNVEVDIGLMEAGEPQLTAECERVYERELVRERELQEKLQKQAEEENMPPPRVISNVPHGGASMPSTVTTSVGPITLAEPMPNGHPFLPLVTPTRPSTSHAATNGATELLSRFGSDLAPTTNGSHDADAEGDSHMTGPDDQNNSHPRSNETQHTTNTKSSFGATASAQPRPFHSYTAPSHVLRKDSGMSAAPSQTGIVTPMQKDSQAQDYDNEASTTQTDSNAKRQGSRPSDGINGSQSQESGPNHYVYGDKPASAGTDYPDTQGKHHVSQATYHY